MVPPERSKGRGLRLFRTQLGSACLGAGPSRDCLAGPEHYWPVLGLVRRSRAPLGRSSAPLGGSRALLGWPGLHWVGLRLRWAGLRLRWECPERYWAGLGSTGVCPELCRTGPGPLGPVPGSFGASLLYLLSLLIPFQRPRRALRTAFPGVPSGSRRDRVPKPGQNVTEVHRRHRETPKSGTDRGVWTAPSHDERRHPG
jgi:hypothetical protein